MLLSIALASLIQQRHAKPATNSTQLRGNGRNPDNANTAPRFLGSRLLQNRREQLRKRKVAEAIGAELHLIPLRRLGALRRRHDACIVEEHVQAVAFGGKGLGGGFDGGQVA